MTPRTRQPVSRRERPAKPALSRAGIVEAALGVLRAEGLEKVTMRRLAQELDTGPASLYVYVASTAELHAAVLDELLGEVELGRRGDDWAEALIAVLVSYTDVLFAHPALAGSAVSARPSGRNYLRLLEKLLALLGEGGVPDEQAAWGVDLLLLAATAVAAEHSAPAGTEDWDATRQAVENAPAETHPRVRALAGPLLSGSAEERLTWHFRTLINGIRHTPVPKGEPL
ncbi:TetR/AcrR family transcriptional regulator [Amycolatopsis acididurans]|uniref:TetR/AcrR family transcriptional regulator n=1 Tax=Amycolatopsis acididurans TaxID=2724524 RepID=UPI0028A93E9A|nr:TetR/AcrR family transcriptional regulator [Amycolatopsis acididurans]